jgi:hypothetical protein
METLETVVTVDKLASNVVCDQSLDVSVVNLGEDCCITSQCDFVWKVYLFKGERHES